MIEFLDSFDHYTNTELTSKWTAADVSSGFGVNAGYGRSGPNGYRAGGGRPCYKDMTAKQERWIGFAIKWTSSTQWEFLKIMDGASDQVYLYMESGLIKAARGGGTNIATGTTIQTPGVWYFVECHVVIDNSVGELEVRLNGNVEFALTSQDTQVTANATFNRIYIGGPSSGPGEYHYDDIYVLDNVDSGIAGAPNNDFLGDVKVECLFPNGNGNASEFDGSDGNSTDNYLLVDEASPDSDTTYVQSGVAGEKDTYAFGSLATTSGTVFGVQVMPWAKKTDAGVRTLATVARLGSVEEDSSDFTLATGYGYHYDTRDGNPDGDQWTIADINSAEFGVKVT